VFKEYFYTVSWQTALRKRGSRRGQLEVSSTLYSLWRPDKQRRLHREGSWDFSTKQHHGRWRQIWGLRKELVFPDVVQTSLRPDIVVWSEVSRKIIMIELTVPWKDACEEAHERKIAKYADLADSCRQKGWSAWVLPDEVGAEVSQHSLSGECTRRLAWQEPRERQLLNSLLMLQRGHRVGSGFEGKSNPGDLTIAGSDQSLPTPSTWGRSGKGVEAPYDGWSPPDDACH